VCGFNTKHQSTTVGGDANLLSPYDGWRERGWRGELAGDAYPSSGEGRGESAEPACVALWRFRATEQFPVPAYVGSSKNLKDLKGSGFRVGA